MRIFTVILILSILSCTEKMTGIEQAEDIQAINNRDYFDCVLAGAETATERIDLLMYLAKYTPQSEDSVYLLLNSLVEADRRGITVRVLFENSLEENVLTADYLMGEGVDVGFDSPGVTTHAKFVLFDSQFLLLGSSNWTNHALRLNNETNLLVSQPELVQKYRIYFDQLWAQSKKSAESPLLSREP